MEPGRLAEESAYGPGRDVDEVAGVGRLRITRDGDMRRLSQRTAVDIPVDFTEARAALRLPAQSGFGKAVLESTESCGVQWAVTPCQLSRARWVRPRGYPGLRRDGVFARDASRRLVRPGLALGGSCADGILDVGRGSPWRRGRC